MSIRPFRKTKRILTHEEKLAMRDHAVASAEQQRLHQQEKERLVAEGKLRKEIVQVDSKTTIIRYMPVNNETNQ